eukprot:CAMPEP_0185837582 /NCGR_PEP_ID=MMETSP1353-20130828/11627_1 /TAXON_ID=1077150 /ORGANISM="Erythrolobus australicus, Strain CCMP3124" /LENGTH=420 /DNA_ID=CAMNT_0028536517 /DNA_START=246 /DNA_END=1511 /DNA_ORIENTATION=+
MKALGVLPPQSAESSYGNGGGSGSNSRELCRSSRAKLDPSLTANIKEVVASRTNSRGWRSANCSGDFRADAASSELLDGELERTGSQRGGGALRMRITSAAGSDGLARSKTLGMKLRKSLGANGNAGKNMSGNWLASASSSVTLGHRESSSPGLVGRVSRHASGMSDISEGEVGAPRRERAPNSEDNASSCDSLYSLDFAKFEPPSGAWASAWYSATTNELRGELEFFSRALLYLERVRAEVKEHQLRAFFAWFLPFAELYAAHLDFVDYTLLPLIKRRAGLVGSSLESEGLHVQLMLKISKLKQLEKSTGSRQMSKIARDVVRQGVAFVCMALESMSNEEGENLTLLDKHGVESDDLPMLKAEQLSQYFKETNLLLNFSDSSRALGTLNQRVVAHFSKRASQRKRSNLQQILDEEGAAC